MNNTQQQFINPSCFTTRYQH